MKKDSTIEIFEKQSLIVLYVAKCPLYTWSVLMRGLGDKVKGKIFIYFGWYF